MIIDWVVVDPTHPLTLLQIIVWIVFLTWFIVLTVLKIRSNRKSRVQHVEILVLNEELLETQGVIIAMIKAREDLARATLEETERLQKAVEVDEQST